MAFPEGLILVDIQIGAAITHTGAPVRLDVRVTPSMRLVHEASGTVISAIPILEVVAAGETLTLQLPAVDQGGVIGPDGLPATFWNYTIDVRESRLEAFAGVFGTAVPVGRYVEQETVRHMLQPRIGESPIDLDLHSPTAAVVPALGPVWAGPGPESNVPADARIWYDTTDPDRVVIKARSL